MCIAPIACKNNMVDYQIARDVTILRLFHSFLVEIKKMIKLQSIIIASVIRFKQAMKVCNLIRMSWAT